MKGIQPTWPSLKAILRLGIPRQAPRQTASRPGRATAFSKVRATTRSWGRSGDVVGSTDDEPMCMLITVSVSAQAAKNGSQYAAVDARQPELEGLSEKATACDAHAGAAADLRGRQLRRPTAGTSVRGISRPAAVAAAPLVDHPVVVDPDAHEGELLVLAVRGTAARKSGARSGNTATPRCGCRPCRPDGRLVEAPRAASRRRSSAVVGTASTSGPTAVRSPRNGERMSS